ncbi:FAD-binding oxidoreductase [Pelagibius litoralis]|uniref:FAD-binding oxidoreductase n=1 Tax=Pelagibius litoralis TaxID=374515 RepID=A0A967K6Q4_9PROT|nr:FAD-binding oxidoreductase [Pelagibius litoralis]NIA69388.1 FAD-binding oxidoreductase [Pelagibius litoralis]
MTKVDVAVIGGGLVGCSAALHLRRRGASVVLLERRRCGGQASGVNYGGVRQQGRDLVELPLARRSRRIWAELDALVGTDCEFEATGHLKLARSESEMAELEIYASRAREFGLQLETIGPERIRTRFPWLGDGVVGGSFCAEDGHANPRLVAPAFARAAVATGADIREEIEVLHACHDGEVFELCLSDGTSVRAGRLINAAGAWGSTVSAWFGEPVPEEVMAPNMCVTGPIPYFLVPNLGVCGGGVYVRQIRRGNVIFGAGVGVADRDEIVARPLADVTAGAVRLAVDLVPKLASAQIIRTWTGIEGVMPDGLPVVGLSETTPGLIHAFGFSGHGFQLGPGVGAVLSELAIDVATTVPIDPFRIGRFSNDGTSRHRAGSAASSPGRQSGMQSGRQSGTTRLSPVT